MFSDFSRHDVDELVCDALLTGFVVKQGQFLEQIIGIVVCCLHGEHTRGMFAGERVKQDAIDLGIEQTGEKGREEFLTGRLGEIS